MYHNNKNITYNVEYNIKTVKLCFSGGVLISTTKRRRSHTIPNEKIENLINSNRRKRRKPFFLLYYTTDELVIWG